MTTKFKTGDKVVRTAPYEFHGDDSFMQEGREYKVVESGEKVLVVEGKDIQYDPVLFKLVQPKFTNMKFRVSSPEQSKEIQEALFEMGYTWQFWGKEVVFADKGFPVCSWLHTDEDGILYRSWQDPDDKFSSISPFQHQEFVVETTKSYKLIPVEITSKDVEPETITIDGKTYDKEAVLKRLAELESIQ